MKNYLCWFLLFVSSLFIGCVSLKPADFSYIYDGNDTGLSKLIDADGCYVLQRECDPEFFSVFMFYPDGLFTIATTSDVDTLLSCFENGGKTNLCKYPSWGVYTLSGDTIKTQTIFTQGVGSFTIFRDYLILPDKSIQNVSEYINSDKTKLMFKNYPSFYDNQCRIPARFIRLSNKRGKNDCPYLKNKWFYKAQ